MKIKGRTILVLALLVFGGYAVFDYFQDKKKEEKTMEESRLMTVNFDQVDMVEIERGESRIVAKKTVDGWELKEPLMDAADNTAIDDLVKNSFTERIIEVAMEGANINWATYGLDKPMGKITYTTSAGKKNTYEISEKRNFEENAFLRRDGENRVLVVNSIWQTRVGKTVKELRERRFLRKKIASVDELRLKNEKGLLQIKRVEGKWTVVGKNDLKVDQNKVRELLSTIADAKASEILDKQAPPSQLKSLFSLELTLGDKKWSAEVGQAKDMLIFAKTSDPQFQMKMEAGALDKLIKFSVEDLKELPPKKEEKKGSETQPQIPTKENK